MMTLRRSARCFTTTTNTAAALKATLVLGVVTAAGWLALRKVSTCAKRRRRSIITSADDADDDDAPEGLKLFRDFLTVQEHDALVAAVDALEARLRDAPRRNRSYSRIAPAFAERGQSRVTLQFGAFANANRVQETERVEPMPEELSRVAACLVSRGVVDQSDAPDTCCVNLYEPGNWIPPHVDNPAFARPFVTVSLVSEQRVEFTTSENEATKRFSYALPARSALVVGGEAADAWRHAVPPVTARRVSLTFRKLRPEARALHEARRDATAARRAAKAEAKRDAKASKRRLKADRKREFQNHLATQQERGNNGFNDDGLLPLASKEEHNSASSSSESSSSGMRLSTGDSPRDAGPPRAPSKRAQSKRSTPLVDVTAPGDDARRVPRIETEHVWAVYEAIAPQWHGTRYKAWPRVAAFARQASRPGALVGDVGCGNGKNAEAICANGALCLACDVSKNLLEIAERETKEKLGLRYECLVADAAALPWRDDLLDAVLSVAVLHHVSTEKRRLDAVAEALRVLKPHGRALFYAWARDQLDAGGRSGHVFAASDVLVPFHLRRHGEHYLKCGGDANPDLPDHTVLDEFKNAHVLQRYCHVFADGELETLVRNAAAARGFHVHIDDVYYDEGNWAVVATKLPPRNTTTTTT